MSKKAEEAQAVVLQKLKTAQGNGDTEMAHINADDALCAFLRALGYEEVANEFEEVSKWYA